MKKLIIAILIAVMIPVIALADGIDLSSLTYSQLLMLRNDLTEEIMNRPEWKEVEVPAGTWIVGDQIPVGTYCIKSKGRYSGVTVWKKAIDDYSDGGLFYNEVINENSPCGRIVLQYGYIFVNSQPVIFAPPMTLGF